MKAILFDIDGTLADIEHRVHLVPDWPKFFGEMHNDSPIEPIVDLARLVFSGSRQYPCSHVVIVVTARPEQYRRETAQWLNEWFIPFDQLYMRKENDFRPDTIIKAELLQDIIDDGFNPTLVVDDRPEVVEMWREYGLTCLQCASNEIKPKHDGKQFLDLLVGPSGAGKSTYVSENYSFDRDVVSTDYLRAVHGWGHSPDDLQKTWSLAHALMRARLENGVFTAFDATNIKQKDRLKLLRHVPKGQYVRYIVIDRNLDSKLKCRDWRPEDLVLRHHRTMQKELPNILSGDGLPNVVVIDKRQGKS